MYELIKRAIDIILTIILGIIFLPICVLAAIAIKLDGKGPILADTPERVGKNGGRFKMYKFRSMVENAHEMLRFDPQFESLYKKYKRGNYKLRHDPRVTRVGHFIRKHSIDEIPQFLNVLTGDMSIVGPRAYYPDEIRDQQEKYPHTKDLVKVVLSVRPGITGAWQVSGRSEVNFDKRIKIDADYVKRKNIFYDMIILIKTPWAMISGKGAL